MCFSNQVAFYKIVLPFQFLHDTAMDQIQLAAILFRL